MEELLKKNLDTIFSYSLFITGNREKALDLMQDTIVTVLNKKHLYSEESHFKSWIFRVLKNTYLNQIKKDGAKKEILWGDFSDNEDNSPLFLSEANGNIENINDPILRNKINSVIASIPFDYREVVIFIELDGMSYEEVAKELNIPVGTVMSRLHRGRSYLRKMLRKEAGELRIISEKVKRNA